MLVPLVPPMPHVLDGAAVEPSDESLFRKCLNEKGFSSRRGSSGIPPVSWSAATVPDLWEPIVDDCCKSLMAASECDPKTPLILPPAGLKFDDC